MITKKTILIISALIILVLSVLAIIYFFYNNRSTEIFASGATENITTTGQWELGTTKDNINISEGSLEIADMTGSKIDLALMYNDNPSDFILYTDCTTQGTISNTLDENVATALEISDPGCTFEKKTYLLIDFGQDTYVSGVRINAYETIRGMGEVDIESSDNGVTFEYEGGTNIFLPELPTWHNIDFEENKRYYRFITYGSDIDPPHYFLNEYEIYGAARAIHITDETQIDGQEGSANKTLIEWTSFEVMESTPLGTSISYEFRVSNDAENWTDWTGDFLSLEARRYLQVKATLTTADPLVTPQIDDYTINFHNNQAPNAPTAVTAVIGD